MSDEEKSPRLGDPFWDSILETIEDIFYGRENDDQDRKLILFVTPDDFEKLMKETSEEFDYITEEEE